VDKPVKETKEAPTVEGKRKRTMKFKFTDVLSRKKRNNLNYSRNENHYL